MAKIRKTQDSKWPLILLLQVLAVAIIYYFLRDVITSILSLLILLMIDALFIPRFDTYRKNHPEFINLTATMLATIFGVYLAFSLTNRATEKEEKEKVIGLLSASMDDINVAILRIGYVTKGWDSTFKNNDSLFREERKALKEKNYANFYPPRLISTIIENELVVRNLQPIVIMNLSGAKDNYEIMYRHINFGQYKNLNELAPIVIQALDYNEMLRKIVKEQIDYLKDPGDPKHFEKKINVIVKSPGKWIDPDTNVSIE